MEANQFLGICLKHVPGKLEIDFDAVATETGMSVGGARNKFRALQKTFASAADGTTDPKADTKTPTKNSKRKAAASKATPAATDDGDENNNEAASETEDSPKKKQRKTPAKSNTGVKKSASVKKEAANKVKAESDGEDGAGDADNDIGNPTTPGDSDVDTTVPPTPTTKATPKVRSKTAAARKPRSTPAGKAKGKNAAVKEEDDNEDDNGAADAMDISDADNTTTTTPKSAPKKRGGKAAAAKVEVKLPAVGDKKEKAAKGNVANDGDEDGEDDAEVTVSLNVDALADADVDMTAGENGLDSGKLPSDQED